MSSRPGYLDLRSQQGDGRPRTGRGAPSPRIEHFDGEIPPALSPLDAFAAQGRMLARQLDESMKRDRRMSRLPPASVARSLSQPRPGYFRSPASDRSHKVTRSPEPASSPAVEEPKFRPQSEHPRLSGLSILRSEDGNEDSDQTPVEPAMNPPEDHQPPEGDYFGAPRAESPEEDLNLRRDQDEHPNSLPAADPVGVAESRGSSTDSSRPQISTTLAPPVSPLPPKNMQPESSDDDYTSSNAGSTFSKPRKLSSSSGMSMPHSPISPYTRSRPRSPSISSEASNTGHLPRPAFNFSRPLSRSSTSLSAPSPGVSSEPPSNHHHHPVGIQRENKPAPINVSEPDNMARSTPEEDVPSSAVSSSYIYTKYPLPRGRKPSRNSQIFSGLQTPHFEWKEPLFESSPSPRSTSFRNRTPSPPPPRNSQETASKTPEKSPQKTEVHASPSSTSIQPADAAATTTQRPSQEAPRENPDETKSSADSESTVRPQTARTVASSVINMTAEEHVQKGIECHENGSLQESTYHLRIAAKQNHPTGMLLYALACRHGWGMRPNPKEGVQWLRKAVDCAGLEMVEDDNSGTKEDIAARKALRAQFALAIYELGVSHLKGWGIEQDKSLALRCFEIAGQWGDVDALAEAGFCYAEGIGCKKDLKKAAKFYRMAEAKGMSMVGNSWYGTLGPLLEVNSGIANDHSLGFTRTNTCLTTKTRADDLAVVKHPRQTRSPAASPGLVAFSDERNRQSEASAWHWLSGRTFASLPILAYFCRHTYNIWSFRTWRTYCDFLHDTTASATRVLCRLSLQHAGLDFSCLLV